MGNVNKAKGTVFETATVKHLRAKGFAGVYRPATKGKYDTGDVNGIDNGFDRGRRQVIIQCKNAKTFKLSEWLNDTVDQAGQDEVRPRKYSGEEWQLGPTAVPVLLVKRPGVGATQMGKQYAVLQFDDLLDLLREAGYR